MAELFRRVGLQRPCLRVERIGEQQMVDQLGHPTIAARLERRPRLGQQRRRAPGQRHISPPRFHRRMLVQIGRIAVGLTQIALIDCLGVVVQRLGIAARIPLGSRGWGQGDLLGDLQRRQPVVGRPRLWS